MRYVNERNKGFRIGRRKHYIRLSVSNGLTQGTSNILEMGIGNAILGTKSSDTKTSLTDLRFLILPTAESVYLKRRTA